MTESPDMFGAGPFGTPHLPLRCRGGRTRMLSRNSVLPGRWIYREDPCPFSCYLLRLLTGLARAGPLQYRRRAYGNRVGSRSCVVRGLF